MSALELAIEELKALPPLHQDEAVQFIHSLKQSAMAHKQAVLEKTYGCLTPEEAAEWEAAIEEGNQIDYGTW